MAIQKIEPYDTQKLAEARRLVNEVYCYYYASQNSQVICGRLATVRRKLDELLAMKEDASERL